jgi:excisionase family DNA binding protein
MPFNVRMETKTLSGPDCVTFTVEETAALLGLSRNLAYAGVASGQIPSVKIGRRIVVPRLALERLLGSPTLSTRMDGLTQERTSG